MLKDIRNFRCGFVISLALITFLTNPAIPMPHKAHSQSFPSIPKIGSINTTSNNKAVILNFDDGYKSEYTNAATM